MNIQTSFLTVVAGVLAAGIAQARCQDGAAEVLYEQACTKIQTHESRDLSATPVLLIAIHGDSPPGFRTGAHYEFARRIANRSTNLVAVGLTRPGYTDVMGRTSDGVEGEGVGDNYDETRVAQIAGAVQRLMRRHRASRVILIGQSGGAAVVANLIGLHPGLVDHAFLLACPCDINAWRRDMFERTGKAVFKGDLANTSPIDLVEGISSGTSITLFAGKRDTVTKPALIEAYEAALLGAGKKVRLVAIDAGHEIFLRSEVFNEVVSVIAGYNTAPRRLGGRRPGSS